MNRLQQLAGIIKENFEPDYSPGELFADKLKQALEDYYDYVKGDDFEVNVLNYVKSILKLKQGTPEELSTPPNK